MPEATQPTPGTVDLTSFKVTDPLKVVCYCAACKAKMTISYKPGASLYIPTNWMIVGAKAKDQRLEIIQDEAGNITRKATCKDCSELLIEEEALIEDERKTAERRKRLEEKKKGTVQK